MSNTELALGKDEAGHDILVANGHTYRVHNVTAHRSGAYVYALGHRVYGRCRGAWSVDKQRYEATTFVPEGKWAFILAPVAVPQASVAEAADTLA